MTKHKSKQPRELTMVEHLLSTNCLYIVCQIADRGIIDAAWMERLRGLIVRYEEERDKNK